MPSEAERSRILAALDAAGENVVVRIEDHDLALTHLDRVYWPAQPQLQQSDITKRDFLQYLVIVAPAMLSHVRDRPLTLFRWPEGIAKRRVLEKHWNIQLPAFVERVNVFSASKGHADQYILCNNLATLLWLAHMGTLEFHIWHSRLSPGPDAPIAETDFTSSGMALQASLLELPDYILFDIDPFIYSGEEAEGTEPVFSVRAFSHAKQVAMWLKGLLDGLSLESLVKTSGKTGLHVIVPIRRTLPFAAAREVARFIGDHLVRQHPRDITVDWSVEKRAGKVFLDTNMNVRGKSITAPYSPRGLAGAPVSMPVNWRRLNDVDPTDFRLPTVAPRLRKRGDEWAGWITRKQDVEASLSAIALR